MKISRRGAEHASLGCVWGLFGFALSMSCSEPAEQAGATAGASTAGSGTATGGASATSGGVASATGGSMSGGQPTTGTGGGSATGGQSQGGVSTGGVSQNGGAPAGGQPAGGAATGGISPGGASTGGAPAGGQSGASTGGATTGGAATGGQGTGGMVVVPPSKSVGLVGWATQSGTTTGGGDTSPQTATSASQLQDLASGSTARVIQFSGSLSVSRLTVGSNKTIIGMGTDATINGGVLLDGSSNVILQNFKLNGASSDTQDGDAMEITGSNHVWIDHMEIWDGQDGTLDIVRESDFITISWTKFRYSANPPSADHRFAMLIGNGDDATEDAGKLRVTLHHVWFAENIIDRMPRVRFGRVHVFNSYYSSTGNDLCIRAGYESDVLVENNYFDRVDTPHECGEDDGTGTLSANGNTYNLSLNTDTNPSTRGTAFDPPYPYELDAVEFVPAMVQEGAGPQ